MAHKSTNPLEKLKDQLTCAVCLELYTNPKTLPCLHSFCLQCLEGLPLDPQGDNAYLVCCPSCRHHTKLPPKGPDGFPTAFHLNNLMEIHTLMKKASNPQQTTCDNCTTTTATGYCKECYKFFCQNCDTTIHKKWAPTANHHITSLDEVASSASRFVLSPKDAEEAITCSAHKKPLEIFCETCNEVICHLCTVRTHRDHEYDTILDSYQKHCHELQSRLNPVKKNVDTVTNVIASITQKENEIEIQGETIEKEIHVMAEDMISAIRESEKQLTIETKRVTNEKLQVLSEQKKSVELSLGILIDCKEYVEQSIEMGSQQQVLMSKKQMMERMSEVTQQINVEEFNPIEKADVQLIKDSKVIEGVNHIGDLNFTLLQQYKVKIKSHLPNKKMLSFPLSLERPDSSLLTVPVFNINCSLVPVGKDQQPIPTTVTATTQPGVYDVHCNISSNGGRYQVNVKIHKCQLESPTIVLSFNPYIDTITPVRTIDEFRGPAGVTVSDDGNHIMVTENRGNSVKVLNREGKKLKSFGGKGGVGNVKFNCPHGIATTPDNFLLITDNHRIQKVTMNGQLIASAGGGGDGSGPHQFNKPDGIAISPITGHIYVADCGNHRIQVLTPDLKFSHSFGKDGSAEGQFKDPRDIAIDSKGLLYVADRGNNRIQVFTQEGEYITHGPQKLCSPVGITIDNISNLMYVTEWNDRRVSVFTCEGQPVRSFGEEGSGNGQFNGPRGITLKSDGVLYVCDFYNNRLVMY